MFTFVYAKSFSTVFFILTIIFSVLTVYILFTPQVLNYVHKSFKIFLFFSGSFILIHSGFSLKNNGFMKDYTFYAFFLMTVVAFIFALFALLWIPLIWIAGSTLLAMELLVYFIWPPDVK